MEDWVEEQHDIQLGESLTPIKLNLQAQGLMGEEDFLIPYSDIDRAADEFQFGSDPYDAPTQRIKVNAAFFSPYTQESTINRLKYDYDDGFIDNTIFSSQLIDPNNNVLKINNCATNIEDLAFHTSDIGQMHTFSSMKDFDMSLMHSEILTRFTSIQKSFTPGYTDYYINNHRAFNSPLYTDLQRFAMHNMIFPQGLYATIANYALFITEVINTLYPSDICIIGDSLLNEVSIPSYKILPNCKTLPDMKSRIRHIATTMKTMVSGVTDYAKYGHIRVKLSITPVNAVINIALHRTGDFLMIPLNPFNNQYLSMSLNSFPLGEVYNNKNEYKIYDDPFWMDVDPQASNIDVYSANAVMVVSKLEGYPSPAEQNEDYDIVASSIDVENPHVVAKARMMGYRV